MARTTRREFLRGATLATAGVVLAACQQPAQPTSAPEPTKAVEQPTAVPEATTVVSQPTAAPEGSDNHDVFRPLLSTTEAVTLSRWDSCASETISARYDALNIKVTEFYPNVTMDLQHGQSAENFVAACAAGSAPDVWSCGWNPERMGIWAKNGCLLALDDYIAEVAYPMERFVPGALDTCRMDGKHWGIPSGIGMYMLWYNPAHIKEAGGDGTPKDTDELWALAEKLTTKDDKGDIDRLGMRLTTWFMEHLTWFCSFGGRMWNDEKNEPWPDNEGTVAAIEDLLAWANMLGVDNLDRWAASIGGQQGVAQPFMSDKLSMFIDGDWYLQQIDELHPEWKPGVEFGVDAAPFAPAAKQKGEPAVSLWIWPQAVSGTSKQPRWGFEFMRWRTSREISIEGAKSTRDLISTVAYLDDPRVDWESAKVILRFLASGKKGVSVPMTPVTGEYQDKMGAAVDEIIHGKATVSEALARVKAEVGELMAKYK